MFDIEEYLKIKKKMIRAWRSIFVNKKTRSEIFVNRENWIKFLMKLVFDTSSANPDP